jgi:hypothetical protein
MMTGKSIIKILIGIVLLLLLLGGCEFLCQLSVKCKNCPETSIDKIASVKGGYYITNYKVGKKNIRLKKHDYTIRIDSVWGEHMHRDNTNICLLSKSIIDSSLYAVVIEFSKPVSDTFIFSFEPIIDNEIDERQGGMQNNKKILTMLKKMPDTIKLILQEKSPVDSIGWRSPLNTDTITLVKE